MPRLGHRPAQGVSQYVARRRHQRRSCRDRRRRSRRADVACLVSRGRAARRGLRAAGRAHRGRREVGPRLPPPGPDTTIRRKGYPRTRSDHRRGNHHRRRPDLLGQDRDCARLAPLARAAGGFLRQEGQRVSGRYYDLHCLLRSDVGEAALADRKLGADCAHHAGMFFHRPDYDLASAKPGTFAVTPTAAMAGPLRNDYANTTAMIFGATPAFGEILASNQESERTVNRFDWRRRGHTSGADGLAQLPASYSHPPPSPSGSNPSRPASTSVTRFTGTSIHLASSDALMPIASRSSRSVSPRWTGSRVPYLPSAIATNPSPPSDG